MIIVNGFDSTSGSSVEPVILKSIENKQRSRIGCPEEIAWRMGWINNEELISSIKKYKENEYGKYLKDLIYKENMF